MHTIITVLAHPRVYLIVEPVDHTPRTRWLLTGPGWRWHRGPTPRC